MRPEPFPTRPGQESVWDYPRPPRLERTEKRIEIEFAGVKLADTTGAWRVLETSHPPVYYLPREDVQQQYLRESMRGSFCEWKGAARYVDLVVGARSVAGAGWFYPTPAARFTAIRDHIAFYPAPMDVCRVEGEVVTPQPGRFYGGWVTSDVAGPFKGAPGSEFW